MRLEKLLSHCPVSVHPLGWAHLFLERVKNWDRLNLVLGHLGICSGRQNISEGVFRTRKYSERENIMNVPFLY